jgi:hypothetical protein
MPTRLDYCWNRPESEPLRMIGLDGQRLRAAPKAPLRKRPTPFPSAVHRSFFSPDCRFAFDRYVSGPCSGAPPDCPPSSGIHRAGRALAAPALFQKPPATNKRRRSPPVVILVISARTSLSPASSSRRRNYASASVSVKRTEQSYVRLKGQRRHDGWLQSSATGN